MPKTKEHTQKSKKELDPNRLMTRWDKIRSSLSFWFVMQIEQKFITPSQTEESKLMLEENSYYLGGNWLWPKHVKSQKFTGQNFSNNQPPYEITTRPAKRSDKLLGLAWKGPLTVIASALVIPVALTLFALGGTAVVFCYSVVPFITLIPAAIAKRVRIAANAKKSKEELKKQRATATEVAEQAKSYKIFSEEWVWDPNPHAFTSDKLLGLVWKGPLRVIVAAVYLSVVIGLAAIVAVGFVACLTILPAVAFVPALINKIVRIAKGTDTPMRLRMPKTIKEFLKDFLWPAVSNEASSQQEQEVTTPPSPEYNKTNNILNLLWKGPIFLAAISAAISIAISAIALFIAGAVTAAIAGLVVIPAVTLVPAAIVNIKESRDRRAQEATSGKQDSTTLSQGYETELTISADISEVLAQKRPLAQVTLERIESLNLTEAAELLRTFDFDPWTIGQIALLPLDRVGNVELSNLIGQEKYNNIMLIRSVSVGGKLDQLGAAQPQLTITNPGYETNAGAVLRALKAEELKAAALSSPTQTAFRSLRSATSTS